MKCVSFFFSRRLLCNCIPENSKKLAKEEEGWFRLFSLFFLLILVWWDFFGICTFSLGYNNQKYIGNHTVDSIHSRPMFPLPWFSFMTSDSLKWLQTDQNLISCQSESLKVLMEKCLPSVLMLYSDPGHLVIWETTRSCFMQDLYSKVKCVPPATMSGIRLRPFKQEVVFLALNVFIIHIQTS